MYTTAASSSPGWLAPTAQSRNRSPGPRKTAVSAAHQPSGTIVPSTAITPITRVTSGKWVRFAARIAITITRPTSAAAPPMASAPTITCPAENPGSVPTIPPASPVSRRAAQAAAAPIASGATSRRGGNPRRATSLANNAAATGAPITIATAAVAPARMHQRSGRCSRRATNAPSAPPKYTIGPS
ncbi:unannotated protein [freshwater metagenome]|uniref:Unannotated protein n=1 Tax=freshwater metagenome TaxID=449393 RepID=A0A6J6G3A5_9ZZZZ